MIPGMRIREDGRYFAVFCAGCGEIHGWLPLNGNGRENGWTWDEATKTLTPSVRHFTPIGKFGTPEYREETNCHYNITSGRIHYHADSFVHGLRGDHELQDPPPDLPLAKTFGFRGSP